MCLSNILLTGPIFAKYQLGAFATENGSNLKPDAVCQTLAAKSQCLILFKCTGWVKFLLI